MNTQNQFNGAGTALITPFHQNGEVDYQALNHLINRQIAGGIGFLVPCGTTGESPTLSHNEHDEVVEFVVREAKGRVPVLAGTGSNNTTEAVRLTKAAKACGANGALVVMPYYNKPTPDGVRDYYRQIAKVGLPVILYDIPGRCGGQMAPAQVILELAREGTIQGLKWASGNLDQLMDVLAGRPQGFKVFSGDDNLTYSAMCLSADDVISVLSNLLPKAMAEFVAAMNKGDHQLGLIKHYQLLPLMRAMFIETNPIPIKEAMAMVWPRVYKPVFRSPMCCLTEANRENLKRILGECGLLANRDSAR